MDAKNITPVSQKAWQPNALKHGAYSRVGLYMLPKGADHIRRKVGKLRDELEAAVVAKHGQLSVKHGLAIHAVCTHHSLIELLQRHVRKHYDGMGPETLATLTENVSRELIRRDAALERLGLDGPPPNLASLLFGDKSALSRPPIPNGSGAGAVTPNAGGDV